MQASNAVNEEPQKDAAQADAAKEEAERLLQAESEKRALTTANKKRRERTADILKETFLLWDAELKAKLDLYLEKDHNREGFAAAYTKGYLKGYVEGAMDFERKTVLEILTKQFGTLPPALRDWVEQANTRDYSDLMKRSIKAKSLTEFADLYANAPE